MSDKTKAALQSCQCHYQMFKQAQNTRVSAGGQNLSELQNSNSVLKDFSSNRGEVFKTYIRQWRTLGHTAKNYPDIGWNQPFGSIPRCCSSLRNIRLIHVARDESPSLRISSSSCARNSSLKRIWYCGDFFNSCIDMCNYPDYHLSVITRVITFGLKSNAPDCSSSAEASNQTVIRGNDHG
ncbi:Uncharacterised protein [Klebsiella grimontii]|nr:Uncharacterised protein [Klebsiella grimontii]DAZ10778.1 MAG TPA: hypothetical protein [Caudoviricetes sp.]